MKNLSRELSRRKASHLYRSRRILQTPQGAEVIVDGKEYISFSSNDYLGLANHPEVVKSLQHGAQVYGAGSGAAHLVTGHSVAHHQLEEEFAEFLGRPRALLFSTGYMANIGVMNALLQKGDVVYEDRLNHASLLDAGLLSGARLSRYKHNDTSDLINKLAGGKNEKLVATDGVFSMDGDIAPLPELAEACSQHEAWFMVDDAHGIGVLGEQGMGTTEYFGMSADSVPILMCTLGKAIGTFGAVVAGSDDLIETLIQQARTYIYTTAIPPAIAEATRTSLSLVQTESWRRHKLTSLVERFRKGATELGLPVSEYSTPIQPIITGSAEQAINLSEQLMSKGLLISAIRPPTVPERTSRLRITFSAAHEEEHVDRLLSALEESGFDFNSQAASGL